MSHWPYEMFTGVSGKRVSIVLKNQHIVHGTMDELEDSDNPGTDIYRDHGNTLWLDKKNIWVRISEISTIQTEE